MKAIFLKKYGKSSEAFELKNIEKPIIQDNEVLIETEAFGLNFADVMARLGYYKACPPIPAVIGYDVVGRIIEKSQTVNDLEIGQRVVAMTRFGGYATHVATNRSGVVPVSETADAAELTALATQYATAYFASHVATSIFEGEHILIQAAAGGVGIALTQLAKNKGCIVYGTAGSDEKINFLKTQGVDVPINYRNQNFEQIIEQYRGKAGIDAAFDSIGGKSVKKTIKMLAPGGRIVLYGAAQIAGNSNKKQVLRAIKTLIDYGKYHPTKFFFNSQSLIGINMLSIADQKPQILQACLRKTVELYDTGKIKPVISGRYSFEDIVQAHDILQNRKSIGKIAIFWKK